MKQILHNTKFNPNIIDTFIEKQTTHKKITLDNPNSTPQRTKKKWATFTYVDKQTRFITKLFKNTPVNIAYRTNTP